MRNLPTLLSVPLFALAFAGQAAGPEYPEKCAIEGAVVDAGRGVALAGAEVRIRQQEQSSPWLVVTTDALGHYSAEHLEPGRYTLYAQRSGYVTQTYGQHGRSREGATLVLQAGEKLHGVDFRLVATGVIVGHVLRQDGEPIVGAFVQAFTRRYVQGELRFPTGGLATTNDLGEYRIYGLGPGHYYVGVSGQEPDQTTVVRPKGGPPEERYIPTLYPGVADSEHAVPIDVQPGAEVGGIDIFPLGSQTFHIRGSVLGFNLGDQYTRVQLRGVGADWGVARQKADIAPGAEGNFDFGGVVPGPYVLFTNFVRNGRYYYAWRAVSVGNADVDGASLTPTTGSELQGRVQVEGDRRIDLRRLSVSLSKLDWAMQSWTRQVASDGSFTFHGVGGYSYLVGISGLPEDFYVKSIRLGEQKVWGANLDLGSSEGPAGLLEIGVSGDGGQIYGVARSQTGEPASRAVVVLAPDSGHRREVDLFKSTTSDRNGRFIIAGIRPGDYKLFAWEDIEPGEWWDPGFLRRFEERGLEVRIVVNGHANRDLQVISLSAERF